MSWYELTHHTAALQARHIALKLCYGNTGSRLSSRCVFQTRRKVRAPTGKVPGNTWEARAYGQCHRKQTATLPMYSLTSLAASMAMGELQPQRVRVKRCGKSAPR